MENVGLHLGIGSPNATIVGQVMDDLFQIFKGYYRTSTQDLFKKYLQHNDKDAQEEFV